MSGPTTIAIVDSWIGPHGDTTKLDDPRTLPGLVYMREGSDSTYWKTNGYSYVGKATIALEPISKNDMIVAKTEALRAEVEKTRADAAVKVMRLEDQISKLLALDFNGMVSSDDDGIPF